MGKAVVIEGGTSNTEIKKNKPITICKGKL